VEVEKLVKHPDRDAKYLCYISLELKEEPWLQMINLRVIRIMVIFKSMRID
jgi:hypothetical protein